MHLPELALLGRASIQLGSRQRQPASMPVAAPCTGIAAATYHQPLLT